MITTQLTRNQKTKAIYLTKNWDISDVQDNAKKVLAKLSVEGLSIKSRWQDIKECLEQTVSPDFCIAMAWILKFRRVLKPFVKSEKTNEV